MDRIISHLVLRASLKYHMRLTIKVVRGPPSNSPTAMVMTLLIPAEGV